MSGFPFLWQEELTKELDLQIKGAKKPPVFIKQLQGQPRQKGNERLPSILLFLRFMASFAFAGLNFSSILSLSLPQLLSSSIWNSKLEPSPIAFWIIDGISFEAEICSIGALLMIEVDGFQAYFGHNGVLYAHLKYLAGEISQEYATVGWKFYPFWILSVIDSVDGIFEVNLDRPGTKNAIGKEYTFETVDKDRSGKDLMICSSIPRVFCACADPKVLLELELGILKRFLL
ncbi:unnamed protein product [Fraxinus pennsylvanica]|uniref:Uncharacterized protein n=1 Tax=Fraxinus pennsylvanica TaxID=56036 RepID=A0AAD1YP76_9LAMI|nr:unnamed protein product [Fraxinus pennsylvanica]